MRSASISPTPIGRTRSSATQLGEFDEPEGHWITLLDPDGNEFCLH